MTYIDNQTSYVLSWPDGGVRAGLEVSVTASSFAALDAVEAFRKRVRRGRLRSTDIKALAAVFVEHVESWDIRRRDGRPVPVKLSAFLRLHHEEVVRPLLLQWVDLVLTPPVEEPAEEPPVEDPVPDIEYELAATTLNPPGADEVLVVDGRPQDPVPVEDGPMVGDGYGDSWRVQEYV